MIESTGVTDGQFKRVAAAHGFTEQQAEFLMEFMSRIPHTHTADQIEDLQEAVLEIVEDDEEEDDS